MTLTQIPNLHIQQTKNPQLTTLPLQALNLHCQQPDCSGMTSPVTARVSCARIDFPSLPIATFLPSFKSGKTFSTVAGPQRPEFMFKLCIYVAQSQERKLAYVSCDSVVKSDGRKSSTSHRSMLVFLLTNGLF